MASGRCWFRVELEAGTTVRTSTSRVLRRATKSSVLITPGGSLSRRVRCSGATSSRARSAIQEVTSPMGSDDVDPLCYGLHRALRQAPVSLSLRPWRTFKYRRQLSNRTENSGGTNRRVGLPVTARGRARILTSARTTRPAVAGLGTRPKTTDRDNNAPVEGRAPVMRDNRTREQNRTDSESTSGRLVEDGGRDE